MKYSIETRACMPVFFRDEDDKKKKLEVMKHSQFHNLLATKVHNGCNTLIKALVEVYDSDSESFQLGNTICKIQEEDVAYLLGLKNAGSVYQESSSKEYASPAIPDFYMKLVKHHGSEKDKFSKRFLHEVLQKLDIDVASEREDFMKLIYYYIFCFIIFPTSQNTGRKIFFGLIKNLESIEKTNWTAVILRRVHISLKEIKTTVGEKNEEKTNKRKVKHANFFTPLLEAWFFFKTSKATSNMDASVAPFIYYVGKGMTSWQAQSVVRNAKVSRLLSLFAFIFRHRIIRW